MISLTKTPRRASYTSWLSRPVNASVAGIDSYIDRQDAVAFWLAYSFAFDDTEPLPAMFRRRAPAINVEARPAAAVHSDYTRAPASRLRAFRVSNMAASYILAGILFLFAAVDAALLTMARFPPGNAATTTWSSSEESPVETAGHSATRVAEALEIPAIELAGESRPLERLEARVNASAEKPLEAADVCAMRSLNCWKSATFIR
jgi:hypothetical protein